MENICSNGSDNVFGLAVGPYVVIYQHGYGSPDWKIGGGSVGKYRLILKEWHDRTYLRWIIFGHQGTAGLGGKGFGKDICMSNDVKNCGGTSYCNVRADIWVNKVDLSVPHAPSGK